MANEQGSEEARKQLVKGVTKIIMFLNGIERGGRTWDTELLQSATQHFSGSYKAADDHLVMVGSRAMDLQEKKQCASQHEQSLMWRVLEEKEEIEDDVSIKLAYAIKITEGANEEQISSSIASAMELVRLCLLEEERKLDEVAKVEEEVKEVMLQKESLSRSLKATVELQEAIKRFLPILATIVQSSEVLRDEAVHLDSVNLPAVNMDSLSFPLQIIIESLLELKDSKYIDFETLEVCAGSIVKSIRAMYEVAGWKTIQ